MIDFTSALYLGLQHPSGSLAPWKRLTTGRPAALGETAAAAEVARWLADLQGCEAAILGPSTLHLFWDFLGMLANNGVAFFMDRGSYPIARWGLERAAGRGTAVRAFRHYDPAALGRALERNGRQRGRPVVVTDGFCTRCGQPAPLAAYLRLVRPWCGHVVVDDTQALGMLGTCPSRAAPYGHAGGGMLRWSGVTGRDVTIIASLAKGFGAPLAALSGSRETVERFMERSETRVHCGPPSAASIHAAKHALTVNEDEGDERRSRLTALVRRFRSGARDARFHLVPGIFPVQTIVFESRLDAAGYHERLLGMGIRPVLQSGRRSSGGMGFLLTAGHPTQEIESVCRALAQVHAVHPRSVGTVSPCGA